MFKKYAVSPELSVVLSLFGFGFCRYVKFDLQLVFALLSTHSPSYNIPWLGLALPPHLRTSEPPQLGRPVLALLDEFVDKFKEEVVDDALDNLHRSPGLAILGGSYGSCRVE